MITAENLTVTFRSGARRRPIKALDCFSLQINAGDVFGLLGPNGAGKSTAMYCFLGLIRPDHGVVSLFGLPPEPGASLFDRIAYVPEEPHYHLYLTVGEALRYYSALYLTDVPVGAIDRALELVGLAEYRDLRLDKCSKGMKQKLGIATCLVRRPDVVFLDEPTRGLDPLIVKEFRDIIRAMNREGTTFVINSHILSEVEMVCNRVAIIDHGRVIVQDDLRALLACEHEIYAIEIAQAGALPPYFQGVEMAGDRVRAIVPANAMPDFFKYISDNGVRVYECTLKRMSLEDAFFKWLHKDSGNVQTPGN